MRDLREINLAMRKNIAVITGGEAAEVGISLKSAAVVCKHLNKEKYNVTKVIIENGRWWAEDGGERILMDRGEFTYFKEGKDGGIKIFDAVFVAIHGTPAEDGKLQGYFELLGIPYNCCGVLQAALTFDKLRCKQYLSQFGIKTAEAVLLKRGEADYAAAQAMALPVFVKPNKNGSSYGASKVNDAADLLPAIENAFKYDDEILVEAYLKGTEVTCGVITAHGKVTALPMTEIRSKSEFFDYKAKYEGNSQEITPAEISADLTHRIQRTTEQIYKQLDFKGMARVDYIIVGDEYYMLEVNSIPGLSEGSLVPQQAIAAGYTLEQLFDMSIEECLKGREVAAV